MLTSKSFSGLLFSSLLFSLLFISFFYYSYSSPDKKFSPEPTPEKVSHPAAPEIKARLSESYGKLPIRFEANVGQTDERVKFLARDKGYSLFLTPQSAVMVLPIGPAKAASGSIKKISLEDNETRRAVVSMSLLNANPAPKMLGEDELVTKSNYFIGSDPEKWQTEVGNFGRVRYLEAYPGIDLIYYGNPRRLEYDFVVSPGANPDIIKIKFEGQDRVEIDESGNLILSVESGRVVQNAPVVYQSIGGKRVPVDGQYVLLGGDSVGFRIGEYDAENDLVIDPQIEFSNYLGGSSSEFGNAIAVDSSGNVYVAGGTRSSDFPTLSPIDGTLAGTQDVFVVKLNATGSAAIYSTFLGGSETDLANAIAVDSSGNAYVVGDTKSSDFSIVGGVDSVLGGTQDAFVSKLNSTGSALIYSTYLGEADVDFGNAIAVDSSGNVYAAGGEGDSLSTLADVPVPPENPTIIEAESEDAFVTKLNVAGSAIIYSTSLGGSSTDLANAIAVDSSGNAYVVGDTKSSDFPTTAGALDTVLGGSRDAFVSKLSAAGSAQTYSTYLGGAGNDFGSGIAVDSSGNAYITGRTFSADFPTVGAIDSTLGGTEDAFVSKLNATGSTLTYSTFLGGTGGELGNGIAVDSSGNAYVVGDTDSSDFPTVAAIYSALGGSEDAFVSKLNAAGSALTFSTYLGGVGFEEGNDVAADSSGNVYVAGRTSSTDFPLAGLVLDTTLGGTRDAYIVKITDDSVPPFNSRFGVLSPYWQSEGGIYTFISVNHPSLSGMNSQIGVVMSAVNQDGGLQGTLEFTLSSNSSQRVFLTPVNFSFSPQTNLDDRFLITGNTSRRGRLQFTPVASNPEVIPGIANSSGRGFADITALSFWGAIVILNTATGFAMEFVGDMQDSRAFSSANFSGVN